MQAFPHKVSLYHSFGLTLETTLDINPLTGGKTGCIAQIDTVLQVAAEIDDGEVAWNIEGFLLEPYGLGGQAIVVTEDKDPALWAILVRAVTDDLANLNERITELALEDAA